MELLALIRETAFAHPDRGLVASGKPVISYRDLLLASARLACDLPPRPHALRMPNCVEAILSVLAAMMAGSDLLLLDASLKDAETLEACSRAGVCGMLVRPGEAIENFPCIEVPKAAAIDVTGRRDRQNHGAQPFVIGGGRRTPWRLRSNLVPASVRRSMTNRAAGRSFATR